MSIPIYESNDHKVNFDKGNKGLFFERFFDQYQLGENSADISENAKTDFLVPFADAFRDSEKHLESFSAVVKLIDLETKQNIDAEQIREAKEAKEALEEQVQRTKQQLRITKASDADFKNDPSEARCIALSDEFSELRNAWNSLQNDLNYCSRFDMNKEVVEQATQLKKKTQTLWQACEADNASSNIKAFLQHHEQLNQYIKRHQELVTKTAGMVKNYQLLGHFVTGMGNEHPVENGFLWHHTLGVPYLSGAQVKGLVRAAIELYYPEETTAEETTAEETTAEDSKVQLTAKQKLLKKWFGSTSKDAKENQAGELIFFDALPVKIPELSVDIMTPHMGDWYAKGGKITNIDNDSDSLPADWHDPLPIPFLAVKDAIFMFSIAPRPNSQIDIDEVFACLEHALTYMGAGAKTQTGYGFMVNTELDQQNSQEQENESSLYNLLNQLDTLRKSEKLSFFSGSIVPKLEAILTEGSMEDFTHLHERLIKMPNPIFSKHLDLINKFQSNES